MENIEIMIVHLLRICINFSTFFNELKNKKKSEIKRDIFNKPEGACT